MSFHQKPYILKAKKVCGTAFSVQKNCRIAGLLESRDSLLECMDEVVVKHIVEVNTHESDDVHHYTAPTLVPDLRNLGCVRVSQVAFPP